MINKAAAQESRQARAARAVPAARAHWVPSEQTTGPSCPAGGWGAGGMLPSVFNWSSLGLPSWSLSRGDAFHLLT